MKKTKNFILGRERRKPFSEDIRHCWYFAGMGRYREELCPDSFERITGLSLKPGEKVRVKLVRARKP